MNRPFFNPTAQQKSDLQFRTQRRGLSSAEEIVTLILKRYGLEGPIEESASPAEPAKVEIPENPLVLTPSVAQAVPSQQYFCWD